MTECRNCGGCGWVCENHRDHPWAAAADVEECCGGAGAPCGVCNLELASTRYVDRQEKAIAGWLRDRAKEDRDLDSVTLWIVASQIEKGEHWADLQGESA